MQKKLDFFHKERIHLIGIGGIGMSGIAQILLALGCEVSGSDLKSSALIEKLKGSGAQVSLGHAASNIKNETSMVIYSSAIKKDNPELFAAYQRQIPVINRAEALALLANKKKTVAVSGAHGKTTTASLISHMLVKCGFNPTICVGGELFSLNGNAFLGKGHYFVLESDESDGTLLTLNPLYSVITNIDREHLDYYRDLEHIIETFRQFMNNTRDEGYLFLCYDDPYLMKLGSALRKRFISFGLLQGADLCAGNIKMQNGQSYFNCICKDNELGEVALNIPGRHNISNALAAIGLGLQMGLEFDSIQQALNSYNGVKRRLELKSKENDILIIEDYAHHPTEIRASLAALKSYEHKRLLAVFQPHRYTRTKFLIDEFGNCFRGVDYLIITDIYPASESPIEGVDAENICRKARQADVKNVLYLPKEEILRHLQNEIRPGDLVAIMGAGDIGSIADELAKEIRLSSAF